MRSTKITSISLNEEVLKVLDEGRGRIPRSRYLSDMILEKMSIIRRKIE